MAESLLNQGHSPDSSKHPYGMKKPAVSRDLAQADVSIQPNTTCAECKKEVKSPHLLCCLHSVCEECLPGMAVEGQQHIKCGECGDTSTHCSSSSSSSSSKDVENQCRADIVHCVPIPNGPLFRYMEGMKVVEKASQDKPIPCESKGCKSNRSASIVFCVDCHGCNFICERCKDGHDVFFADHSTFTLSHVAENGDLLCSIFAQRKPKHMCSQHQQDLLYFCESCSQRFCQVCTTAGEAVSKRHSLAYVNPETDSFESKSSLLNALSVLRSTAGGLEAKCASAEKELQSKIATIEEYKDTALREMNDALNVMQKALKRKREKLHQQIIATAEDKKRVVVSQLECVSKTKQCCKSVHPPASMLQTSGSPHDLLASKDLIKTCESVLNSKWCNVDLESTGSVVLNFETANQETILNAIEGFGIVTDGACSEKCRMEPKPDQLRLIGSDPVTLKVVASDTKGIACRRGGDKISSFLHPKPPTPGPAIKAKVVDNDNGTYSVSFSSVYPDPCLLSVVVNGRDIRGSPFNVTLHKHLHWNIRRFEEHFQFPRPPGNLWGVAVSLKPEGTIFVSDTSNSMIHVFSKERQHVNSFKAHRENATILGLAVGSDELVYVADNNNHCIEVFKKDGLFIRQIGNAEQLKNPWSVTYHCQDLYIADSGNHRVSIYTKQGQHVHTIGSKGSGPGQFRGPHGIAFSTNGEMYVTDCSNHRVQVFDVRNFQYKKEFGQGKLMHPNGIVVTSSGDVLVADHGPGTNCVFVFATCGNIYSFEVNSPRGLAIDNDGNILVAECNACDRRVKLNF